MLSHWFTQLSDRNPQLLREVKGRVTRRNVLVTLALSLGTQLLIVGYNWRRIDSAYAETSASQNDVAQLVVRHFQYDYLDCTTAAVVLRQLPIGGGYR
jgi:hypothetical protein